MKPPYNRFVMLWAKYYISGALHREELDSIGWLMANEYYHLTH